MRLPISPTTLQRSFKASTTSSKLTNATNRVSSNKTRNMSSGTVHSFVLTAHAFLTFSAGTSELNIENTNIKTASGVSLNEQQKTLVGSVLDVSVNH